MIGKLNNKNKETEYTKDYKKDIEHLQSEIDEINETLTTVQTSKADKSAIATEVNTGVVNSETIATNCIAVDYIESKNNADVCVRDKLIAPEVSTDKTTTSCLLVNNVDIVEDYNTKISGAITNACNAVVTANCAKNEVGIVDEKIDNLATALSNTVNTKTLNSDCIRSTCSIETPALTVNSCAEIYDLTVQTVRNKSRVMDSFIEPTTKDATEWYLFRLPAGFNGVAHFVGLENDEKKFSVDFNLANYNTSKGTGLVIHSAKEIYDFFQILYNPYTNVYSFLTQSNITRLYYSYDNYKDTEEPLYEIYGNLTDDSPNYERDLLKYEAKHANQVVVIGDEDTLNGGLTVHGTFYATGFEVPETILTNVHVKCQIYGGYNCSIGEFKTCGTTGGLITYSCENSANPAEPFPTEVITWVNGCPRQVVRKGSCIGEDVDHNECSQLIFETVKTCTTSNFIPAMTDCLFDERGLATYNGTANDSTPNPAYPIVHLGNCSCVHGDLEVANTAKIDGKAVLHCVENTQSCNFNFTNTEQATFTNAKNITVNGCCDATINVCGSLITNAESVCSVINCETKQVNNTAAIRYNCGLSFIAQGGDIDFCNSSNSINIGACCDISLTTPTTSIQSDVTTIDNRTNIDELKVNKVIGLLENTGDIRTHGQVIADGDITTHGDLIVGGSVVATTETQIATTGDYLVTRENNQAAMASTEHSGIVVNNYDGNGSISTLTSDYNGEWRVSDTSSATTTTYTNISNYNNVWYNGLTQTAAVSHPVGVLTETNMIELSSVAYYNSNYYHRNGENWFGPISVVSGKFDLGDMITDATTITALEALPTYSLIYYNSVKDTVISISQNQPLLTRDEKTNLTAGSPLVWDSTNKRAINTPAPGGEQVWKSSIDNLGNITYGWGVASAGSSFVFNTRQDYNAAKLIPLGQVGHIPDGAIVVIKDEDDYVSSENR